MLAASEAMFFTDAREDEKYIHRTQSDSVLEHPIRMTSSICVKPDEQIPFMSILIVLAGAALMFVSAVFLFTVEVCPGKRFITHVTNKL